jgi:hypothetical protein
MDCFGHHQITDDLSTIHEFGMVKQVISAARRAKRLMRIHYSGSGVDFDAVEYEYRSRRSSEHPYKLVLLAQEQGVIKVQSSIDSDDDDFESEQGGSEQGGSEGGDSEQGDTDSTTSV